MLGKMEEPSQGKGEALAGHLHTDYTGFLLPTQENKPTKGRHPG